MLNVEEILAPVSADDACGEDLFFSSEFDAIAHARLADDPSLDQGVWETRCKEADWEFVSRQCAALLAGRSKDLRLAVWLAESETRCGRLGGFAAACDVLAGLCERYWDQLHPRSEDDQEQRIGNLAWLAQRSVQWVGEFSENAAGLQEEVKHACAAVEALERVVDGILGADAPSFGETREVLRRMVVPVEAVPEDGVRSMTLPSSGVATPAFVTDGTPQSRAQALACLRQVAAYFRRQEPHSPVSYLADKAADWGEMPLHVWLRAVVKDGGVMGQLEEVLGAGEREVAG